MKKLKDILEIAEEIKEETKSTIIIKVKENCEYDLMCNGFDPDTTYFRCVGSESGATKSFTSIFKGFKEGNTFNFGTYRVTMVSDDFVEQRNKIWNYLQQVGKDIWNRG